MEHLYVGIDCGKKSSEVFGFTEAGEVPFEGKMSSFDVEGWRRLLKELAERFSIHAAFEVGPHYDWFYDLLCTHCVEVAVIDPAQFAVISRSQRKTDKIDARKLAEGLRRGDLPLVHVPDKQTRADRRLVAFVHWQSQQGAAVKGKIRALLYQHRLECPFTDLLGKSARKWLDEVTPRLDAQAQVFLRMLLAQADLIAEQREELKPRVLKRSQSYAGNALLRTIPGFGPLVSLAILSAIAGIKRFERKERLSSYFGVCGSVHQSGQTLRLGALTKRGNIHVRWLLSQALQHLHRKDARARQRYQRLRRRKRSGVARAAQMRWLTEIVWSMLVRNEGYRNSCKAKQAA